ncbi:hypothetical protein CDD80_4717 [Ophiocordyceps camponoti-rufipedis]|uniref:Calpain catalytic domain-containing protein n=1 Tax=Ophiocordyceps camponoti-rufipedis TaxID=2004952 RepID=A0A2C5Y267_9HYPO|nr:hypothetical protein CDD80_4717 [Ophiocordyceps camponoti-rufipedis]
MERRAQAAEASFARSSGRIALEHAIRAAELYMKAAGETSDKAQATHLRSKCQELIALAEKLKKRQETATTPPQSDILLGVLRLHGNDFPPWHGDPDDDEFELNPGSQYYTDEAPFTLSATQAQNFKAWTRPAELFGLAPDRDKSLDEDILMQVHEHCDLVQDITTDCSVVASLSAAAKVMVGPHAVCTGRISAEEERLMGLIGEHDYAVEDLHSPDGNTRKLLIKNPWRDAPLIVGTGGPDTGRDNTTWITLEDVAQHFETMYLNWNPSLFNCRQDHHLTWELPPNYLATSLVKNPQYSLSSSTGGSIWILVGRHFVDAELEIARSRRGSLAAVARQLGFMSILVFDNGGKRAHVSGPEIYRGPYVDSPQTLARLEASPGKRYTIVIDQHELPLPSYSLTLTLFSNSPLEVKLAEERMHHNLERTGAWSRRNAGGNSSKATYYRNPQYKLVASRSTPVSILLSTDNREVQVHVDVVWARGQRVTSIRVKDLVFSSGEYHRGCAMATIPMLESGTYTLVCSTFDAGQTAAFAIQVSSMSPLSLDPLPAEAAGRLRTTLGTFNPVRGEGGARASLTASWLTRASISVYNVQLPDAANGARHASSVLLRVSVVQGWGSEQVTVAISGDGQFREPTTDLRTGDFDMEPDKVQREDNEVK